MLSVLKSLAYHNVNGSRGLILGLKVCRNLKGAWKDVKMQATDGFWRIRVLECSDITKDVSASEGL